MVDKQLHRRAFLKSSAQAAGGLAALAALGPGIAIGAQGNTITLQLNWIPSVDFAGFYIADVLGYYKQEGVEIKFLPGGPNMQAVEQIVAGGSASSGLPTFLTSTINAVQRNAGLAVIGTVFQTSPLALTSLQEVQLRSAADLVGKRIGAAQGRQRELNAVFKINNLPPNGYKFVPIGYDSTPLIKRDVDVISVFATSEPIVLAEKGIKTNTVLYADLGLPTYTCPIVVAKSTLAENRKALLGFLRASIRGWEVNARDVSIAPKLIAERYAGSAKIDVGHETKANQALTPLTQSDLTRQRGMLWIDKQRIAGPIYKGLTAAGETNLPPVDSFVDTTLLEEAFGGKSTLL